MSENKKTLRAKRGSGMALLASLLGGGISYYAMWALAAVVFALAVYYTVKQL